MLIVHCRALEDQVYTSELKAEKANQQLGALWLRVNKSEATKKQMSLAWDRELKLMDEAVMGERRSSQKTFEAMEMRLAERGVEISLIKRRAARAEEVAEQVALEKAWRKPT